MMLHGRCDLIVATAAIGGGQRGVREVAVPFFNSELVQHWAEVMLETFCGAPDLQKPAPGARVLLRERSANSAPSAPIRWRIILRCMS